MRFRFPVVILFKSVLDCDEIFYFTLLSLLWFSLRETYHFFEEIKLIINFDLENTIISV